MAGISRHTKLVLGLTAGFVLLSTGWFLGSGRSAQPYEVTVQRQEAPGQAAVSEADPRPDSLMEGERIDVNTAGLYDLCRLPGIGEKRGQAILDYRAEHGPFRAVEELEEVSGIGPVILEGLREYVTLGGQ